MNLTKRISLSGMAIGLVLALMLSFSIALAQTETTAVSADIPPELVPLAQDLGCQTTAECALKFDANIEQGIEFAQKYDIYTPEQEKLASTFKTEVLERLRTVSQDNFEEEILTLANKILKEKPALAKTMGVTRQGVNNAETIISTVKGAGVDLRTCQKSPEDLTREQLIACVKAGNDLSSKEKSAGDYIPKGNVKAGEAQQMLDLENSLLAGEYGGLGRIGVEEAGQLCLKPGSESITDCDRIAQKFFGAEGVQELQKARQQSKRVKEYYTEGIERMELVTPDGQKLIGKGAIKNACNSAFEGNNLGLARACGNFAVKNGYATQDEIEDGLKLLETFSQKSQGVNFDDCRFNPESCREFLPDEFRSQFDSQFEIFKIMSESIGFDPSRCENTYDPDIGKQCLEGAKKALGRVEEIAKKSPEARRIVDEIRGHITEGERMTERRDEFNQDSSRGGNAGPGGCRGPEECFKYCSQPANSAECIAFGAKSQIFEQNTVVQRFNIINERNEGFDYRSFPNIPDSSGRFVEDQRFNQYPYPPQGPDVDPGFNRYPYPPQQPVGPSPECFAAISSGDFVKAKTACSSTTENYPRPIVDPFPVCPYTAMPSPCPEGQMRQGASDARGCPTFGACTVIENYRPIDTTARSCSSGQYWDGRSCVTQPTTQCSSGQWWDPATQSCKSSTTDTYKQCDWSIDYLKMSTNTCVARSTCSITSNPDYNSQECQGVRGATQPVSYGCGSFTAQAACQASPGCGWANGACGGNTSSQCASGQWWDPATQSCKSSTVPTVGSCSYSTQYWKASNSTCQPRTNCTDTANPEYSSSECQGVRSSTTPVGSGCGSYASQTSCSSAPACSWQNNACMQTTSTYNTCPAGQYWYYPPAGGPGSCMSSTATGGTCPAGYHYHGDSGGFCMNDQENYSGTCYNSAGIATMTCPQQTYTAPMGCGTNMTQASCTTSSSGCSWQNNACSPSGTSGTACASGQYWNGTACVTSSTTGQCPAGQYWYYPPAGGPGSCMSSTTNSTTCPSGQYWYTPPSGGAGYCMSSTTSSTTCASGQYWDGTACVSSSTTAYPTPTTTYPTPATTYPTPTESYPTPATTYPTPATSYTTPPAYTTPPTGMLLCNQAGGNWTGAACNLAENIDDQKAYYSYFQKDSGSLLAQVGKAFADLFR